MQALVTLSCYRSSTIKVLVMMHSYPTVVSALESVLCRILLRSFYSANPSIIVLNKITKELVTFENASVAAKVTNIRNVTSTAPLRVWCSKPSSYVKTISAF